MRLKTMEDLPSWFSLEKYSLLEELSLSDVRKQFQERDVIFHYLKLEKETSSFDSEFPFGEFYNEWESIVSTGLVETGSSALSEEDDEYRSARLKWTHCVRGVPPWTAEHFIWWSKEKKLFFKDEDYTYMKRAWVGGDISMISKKYEFSGDTNGLYLTLDIEEYSDKEILASIEKLLPIWREQLDFPEPKVNFSKESEKKKIVSYRLIPLMDLLIWAESENLIIPHRLLAIALFPKGEKGEVELKQTVFPLLYKMLSDNYRDLE